MKKLRLLVTKHCERNCSLCCNKQWNLDDLPIVTDFSGYDEIIITGGEPLGNVEQIGKTIAVLSYIGEVFPSETRKIYIHTTNAWAALDLLNENNYISGITLTLHTQRDVLNFTDVNNSMIETPWFYKNKSLRLKVFERLFYPKHLDLSLWKVEEGVKWIENCPLPEDEVFMRIYNIN